MQPTPFLEDGERCCDGSYEKNFREDLAMCESLV